MNKVTKIIKSVGLIILISFGVSCAHAPDFYYAHSPNVTEEQYQQDAAACVHEMLKYIGPAPVNPAPGPRLGNIADLSGSFYYLGEVAQHRLRQDQLFETCMEAKGYYKIKESNR